VYRLENGQAVAATLDFFTPLVDDAEQFGAVAAANSLSDLYAMNVTPAFALAVLSIPAGEFPDDVVEAIYRGAGDVCREAGIAIAGGHSVDDPEPKFGLVAVGLCDPERLYRKRGGEPGDALVLGKGLGTGVITTAIKAQEARSEEIEAAVSSMRRLNRDAADALADVEVHAATDVTGFGLAGHAFEMAKASQVLLTIDIDAVQAGAQAPSPHDWFRDDVPVIVSAGRLHVQKAHRILLRALARLREQRPVRALLLGDGPEQERLEAQSRRLGIFADTSFPGFVDNPYAFMARADALALPSAAEAFGNVAVEALACGTPVVATASSGGPAEILRTDSAAYGTLVPPHSPAALAEALAAAIDRPVNPQRLRRRARDFDVAVAVDRYRALFAQLARGASLPA